MSGTIFETRWRDGNSSSGAGEGSFSGNSLESGREDLVVEEEDVLVGRL